MGAPAFFGQVTIDTTNRHVGITGVGSDDIAVGDYYLHDPQGGANDLLASIAAILSAQSGHAVVVQMRDDGKVEMISGTTFAWFMDTALAITILGFGSSSGTTATSHVATNRTRYAWLPGASCGLTQDAPITSKGRLEAVAKQTEALDGTVWTQRWAMLERVKATLAYVPLAQAYGTYGTYESLWRFILSSGVPLCYAPSWTSAGGATVYHYYVPRAPHPLDAKASVPGSDMYYDCSVDMLGGGLS